MPTSQITLNKKIYNSNVYSEESVSAIEQGKIVLKNGVKYKVEVLSAQHGLL